MVRRVSAMLAWLVVALAVSSPAAGPVRSTATDADVAATAARLDALVLLITGSVQERQAAELVSYHRVEGGLAACMRAVGRPYRQPPFVSFYQDFTDADLGYGNGRGSVVDSVTAGGRHFVLDTIAFARLRRSGAVEHVLAPEDVPAFEVCNAPYEHRSYFDVDPPAGAWRLADFEDLPRPVVGNPAVVAAMEPYEECMRTRHGYVADRDDRTDFLFAQRISGTDAPLDGEPPSPAWTKGVAAVDAVFAADADCRRPAYRAAMTLLAPQLAPWEAAHRTQLDELRRAWRQLVADAAKLPR